jgi:hypothetical protein
MLLLVDIFHISHTNGDGFVGVSVFDPVDAGDGFVTLRQSCNAVDGVCGDGNDVLRVNAGTCVLD